MVIAGRSSTMTLSWANDTIELPATNIKLKAIDLIICVSLHVLCTDNAEGAI